MYKCESCNQQSKKGAPQSKVYEFRKKIYPNKNVGFEPQSEKKVCSKCVGKIK